MQTILRVEYVPFCKSHPVNPGMAYISVFFSEQKKAKSSRSFSIIGFLASFFSEHPLLWLRIWPLPVSTHQTLYVLCNSFHQSKIPYCVVRQGHPNKVSQTGWLKQQTFAFLQFWRLKVTDKGFSSVGFF